MSDGSALQWVFDGLVGLVMALGSYIARGLREDHKDLEGRHEALSNGLPHTYARRDDVREAFDELRSQHKLINDKLDRLIERR